MMSNRRNENDKECGRLLSSPLLPSILCILACAVCLAGVSWGWFSVQLTASVAEIRSAEHWQSVTVQESGAAAALSEGESSEAANMAEYSAEDGSYSASLTRGRSYDICIEPTEGTEVGGYCLISGDGRSYYTRIEPNEPCIITIITAASSEASDESLAYSFKPCWGEPNELAAEELSDGDIICGRVLDLLVSSETAESPTPAAESEAKEAKAGGRESSTDTQGTDGTASDSQLGTAPQSAAQGENTQGAEPSENNTSSEGDSE